MAEITINATKRTEFGKGASRRDRRSGNVPAVIYGHGAAPRHVALPLRELAAALKSANVLLDVVVDGETELTLPKSVTRNPLTGILAHIDLVIVRRGERVKVEVPVHTTGKHDVDGILEHMHNTVEVEAEAETSTPKKVVESITKEMFFSEIENINNIFCTRDHVCSFFYKFICISISFMIIHHIGITLFNWQFTRYNYSCNTKPKY